MKRYSMAALVMAMMALPSYGADEAKEAPPVKGTIVAVTVYRGQALVTRSIDLPAAGLQEVVVGELPDQLQAGSLFAEAGAGIEVRSVRYRERPQLADVRAEVKALDEAIRKLGDQIAAAQKQAQVLGEQRTYLDKLETFTAPTASVEMTKGVLNAEQLKTLTTYQFEQRAAIAKGELDNANLQRDLQEQLQLKQREKNEIARNSSHTLREAVVFLNQEKAGGKLKLRYLVGGATWMPSYNVRADAEKKNATVEYQASIAQQSGEDWANVQMTLSTASPSLVASAPLLNPLTISLGARAVDAGGTVAYDYKAAKGELVQQRQAAENARNSYTGVTSISSGTLTIGGSGSTTLNGGSLQVMNPQDRDLNKFADRIQVLELVAKETKKDESEKYNVGEGVVVTYDLKNATSLPSRADRQLIQIKNVSLKGQFYKVAVPVLTNYVYDEATLTNSADTVLLAGPLASYVGGQFVGNGEIPTVAVGQNFTVGFGIDSSLRATRERTERTETLQGGNKVVKYSYHIAIENFGTAAAKVRVMDRIPTAKETEVKINLVEVPTHPLSADVDYQKFDRKKGLLRWDEEVPPQKARAEAFGFDYKLEMEYDRNLGISSAGGMGITEIEKQFKLNN